MNNTVRVIAVHAKNGVIPLTVLKQKNYPIFRYFLKNYRKVLRLLSENGIQVLNDLTTLNHTSKLKRYLLYYYGTTIDLSLIRQSDRTVYNYLIMKGKPEVRLNDLGFEVIYQHKGSEGYIIKELYRLADKDGNIYSIADAKFYSKLYYRAKKQDLNVKQYINTLGFTYNHTDINEVKKLLKDGLSFSEISRTMNVPRSTLHRLYLQEVSNGIQSGNVERQKKGKEPSN
ncbi:hypothetical protein [Peribacillus frigoritolerans]|uniref:Helix-turn-helix domain-containing protein n=1 Tax=Peribacillus castrilensis TaxID=2897690 RepID=A0AAW9NR29_9BACI|nr:hypothetical protein [Peribacillus castrilensis]